MSIDEVRVLDEQKLRVGDPPVASLPATLHAGKCVADLHDDQSSNVRRATEIAIALNQKM